MANEKGRRGRIRKIGGIMIIKGITKSSAAFYKSLLAEFKPNWNVEITIEDYNLYKTWTLLK